MGRLHYRGFILLFTACMAWANNPLVVSQDLIDVGEVWEAEPVTVNIKIGNKSESPIALGKIRSGCSCVATEVSAETIMPGKQVNLAVKLLREKPGRFNEFVIIQGRPGPDQSVPFKQRIAIEGKTRSTYSMKGMWQDPDQHPPQTMLPFERTESCSLPKGHVSEPGKLMVRLSGMRPDDPAAHTASVSVDSVFFKLLDHVHQAHAAGKLDCSLVLEPKKKWDQGLYYDRVVIKLGPDLKLRRNISFRLIGPVWSEKATINFGRVRAQAPSPRKVLLHFPPSETAWSDIDVIKTEPASFGRTVTVTDVKARGKDVEVTLALDANGLSDTNGFFNFQLHLGNRAAPSPSGASQERPTVKLSVYGMAIR